MDAQNTAGNRPAGGPEPTGSGTRPGPGTDLPDSTDSTDSTGGADATALAAALRLVMGRTVRRLRQGHAVGDVTLSGVSVLARLNSGGPDSPGALAELERVRPQAMAATLAGLEQRGLVGRTPDASDGRRSIVSVTDAGRSVLEQRRSESVDRIARALDEFTPEERAALGAALPLLDRLAEAL
ncbi:MarR family transcriptional regulator [Streptomyces sp. J2-1]|uniref:MarR family winged helix-turn-helix transcriptional regulator n=1 Tax=Streptomyces corallincola TaxID=2851888 RepID=UPI001C383A2B|nr:MarR family transcriptional regulator [Streptomyces corallincola]MBV2356258.1 MarR family transcriptional regulator [Streptomyces corallincola]